MSLKHPMSNLCNYKENIYSLVGKQFVNKHFVFLLAVLSLIPSEMQHFYLNLVRSPLMRKDIYGDSSWPRKQICRNANKLEQLHFNIFNK